MGDYRMPSLGAGMEYGTLIDWHVRPGDEIHRGDIIALVDTFKGAIEVEVFESGVVEELLVQEGDRVPVGEPMARIRTDAEAPAEAPGKPAPRPEPAPPPAEAARAAEPRARPAPAAAPPEPPSPPPGVEPRRVRASPAARRRAGELGLDVATVTGSGPEGAVTVADVERAAAPAAEAEAVPTAEPEHRRVTPLARRVADELGVDLARIAGSGPAGAITRADVERAAGEAGPPEALPPRPEPADRQAAMRQAIAVAMERSKREIPHYYLGSTIDMTAALAWLEEANRQRAMTERLLPAALLLKAVALALADTPDLNGYWIDGAFHAGDGVHIAITTHLRGGGLVAPALHDVDRKTIDDVMRELKDLVQRARAGRLRSSEVADATITVTNLGDRGVETVFGIIYPPQVALVGFGRVVARPWAEGDMVGVRRVVTATLAADHRASDGHRGALFLNAVDRRLQQPQTL